MISAAHSPRTALCTRRAGEDGKVALVPRSVKLVANEVGGAEELTSTSYRRGWKRLKERGQEVHNLHAVIKHFGSWRRAREALDLSASSSARAIEARFDKRRLDKVWRYTAESLRQALADCVETIGHVPQVAECDWWRQRHLELATAQGDDAKHLPSAGPYRRRYGSWEAALLTSATRRIRSLNASSASSGASVGEGEQRRARAPTRAPTA